jgi:hypothetical protein
MPQSVLGGSNQSGFGLVAVPMTGGVAGQPAGSAASANAMLNPLGLNYMYGSALPMNRAQAGLFLLSTQQQMLGLGNGQLSGVRPARADSNSRQPGSSRAANPTAAHTRNANIPGGQAARYFNRGSGMATNSQPYYRRPSPYFPHPAQ